MSPDLICTRRSCERSLACAPTDNKVAKCDTVERDPPISPSGEILLRRYTRRDGTRSLAHDVV